MNKWMRRAGYVLGGALALVLVVVTAVYAVSARRFSHRYAVAVAPLTVPTDTASIARGRHLGRAIAKCVDCHGDDMAGKVYVDDPGLGRLVATNLTAGRGGVGDSLTIADWDRATRHGVARNGRSLRFMSSGDYATLSDADLVAIVAWVRSLSPVDRQLPPTRIGPVGHVLNALGDFPLPAPAIASASPRYAASSATPGATVAYGAYLANVGGCVGCHGAGFSGGHVPGTPPSFRPATNITPAGIGPWTEADFFRAMRDGVRPGGVKLDAFMPSRLTREMSDDEIRALYAYLKTVPRREFGNH